MALSRIAAQLPQQVVMADRNRADAEQEDADASTAAAPEAVSFFEALRYWVKLGFVSFGGPAGQISMMHQELVERRR